MKLLRIALATAFTGATSAAMLYGAAVSPATGPAIFSASAQPAFADEDRGEHRDQEHGDRDCLNPAGHERGWCKHTHKHHNGRNGTSQSATLDGTVLSIDGNLARVRLDDGRIVSVDGTGTQLNVGQHYTLNGCYQNGVFVVNCNGSRNVGGNAQQQVSGTILSINGDIVTLASLPPVRIDVSRARENGAISGQLSLARSITAYGYQQNGTFFATSVR
ncbi:MAG: hypothetical protein NVS1B2_20820 [Vulcanimicrobiaceae bacterium]